MSSVEGSFNLNMKTALFLASLVGVTAARGGCLVPDDGIPIHSGPSSFQQLPQNLTIDVNFHLCSTRENEDLITDKISNTQFEVMRKNFARYDIFLHLNSTVRVVDDLVGHAFLRYEGPDLGWVNYEEERIEFMRESRLGGYDVLNFYFFSDYSPGASGYCSWPTVFHDGDNATLGQDSCQLSAMVMPGFTPEQGGSEFWNLGHLAVHEAGHWFGLNHTFVGGCSDQGDFVADTPAQWTEIYGCPVGSDSCPEQPGLDPIHNFMGYTDDNWQVKLLP